jgi:hypothetical protein
MNTVTFRPWIPTIAHIPTAQHDVFCQLHIKVVFCIIALRCGHCGGFSRVGGASL